MKAKICTASIFAVFCGVLFCAFWFEVPEQTWWGPAWMNHHDHLITVFTWVNNNVLIPAAGLVLAIGVVVVLWKLSEKLCTQLRKVMQ